MGTHATYEISCLAAVVAMSVHVLRALAVGRAGRHRATCIAVLDLMLLALVVAMPGIAIAYPAETRLGLRLRLGRWLVGGQDGLAPDLVEQLPRDCHP